MCGIFGFIAAPGSTCDDGVFKTTLGHLFRLSEPRGREASGLVISSGGLARVFKRGSAPSAMLKSGDYQSFLETALADLKAGTDGRLAEPVAVIGHCRLVTAGAETISGNNQPIITDHSVGVHNGIITNDEALWEGTPEITRQLDSDSEVIFRLLDKHCAVEAEIPAAVGQMFGDIEGAASIAFFRDDAKIMTLATNTGSLYYAHLEDAGVFVFSSERFILDSFLKVSPFKSAMNNEAVRHLQPGSGCVAGFEDARPEIFNFDSAPTPQAANTTAKAPVLEPVLKIVDHTHRVSDIRRCTKCVLPETYPFIEFDSGGVCNYCHDYEPQKPQGRDALEEILAQHRSKDGSPDCIVAFSGGRDSSYGMHYIKNELGMNPIALTYDWGMVTGIARRNQARVCGKLGVEHVLRAADIPAKRRYIRKNIMAWLKRPKLGMVPLFMAGDKMFFHYLREIKKETGIPLVLFCGGNLMERTDFKAGFAGVRENEHGNRLFALSASNKIGLFLWYGWQYLINPRYFNESFLDTMRAYFTTFLEKEDFVYLYHYIPWDEDEINQTLKQEFDWETATGRKNTWRIGDGYTSFINYIYYTVAGFSEYDTFRSCQVREGLLSRDDALAKVKEDNQPHMEALADFARQTGFNLEEVLTEINAIEKLY
ncbi:MAG: hypothetical protein HQ512_13005 [Rhodospirillales bacterium]|nr:hypothetical protein [Rhodospirillales bacterium]